MSVLVFIWIPLLVFVRAIRSGLTKSRTDPPERRNNDGCLSMFILNCSKPHNADVRQITVLLKTCTLSLS